MKRKNRDFIGCTGKGCIGIWKNLIESKKEQNKDLEIFLKDQIEGLGHLFETYDSNINSSARYTYREWIRETIHCLQEYLIEKEEIGSK